MLIYYSRILDLIIYIYWEHKTGVGPLGLNVYRAASGVGAAVSGALIGGGDWRGPTDGEEDEDLWTTHGGGRLSYGVMLAESEQRRRVLGVEASPAPEVAAASGGAPAPVLGDGWPRPGLAASARAGTWQMRRRRRRRWRGGEEWMNN